MMSYKKGDVMNHKEGIFVVCAECKRSFDLSDEQDSEEWFYGHDCESE